MFSDAVHGDVTLSAGSACIDAADGVNASASDLLGASRRDDLDVPDTGNGTPSYVDMGAFEYTP